MISSDEWRNGMSSIPYSRYLIYPLPWYSVLIVTGMVLAVILTWRRESSAGLPKDTVIDLALRILPCGIIGARIYYVVFTWDHFRNNIWSVFRIWEGGIAIYGGIIGGLIALMVFCCRRELSVLLLCDLIAPGLALAQGIGRWGNWFNIEAYGIRINCQRLCFFPFAVQVPADGYAWHMASFFYESLWDICIFIFLMTARDRRLKEKGDVFFFYLFLYSAGRLVIEETRTDSLYLISSVRISQLISVLLCAIILVRYLIIAIRRNGSVTVLTKFVFLPLALLGFAFAMVYAVFGSLFASWSAFRILLCLSVSSLLMISCLFSACFSGYSCEVSHADN